MADNGGALPLGRFSVLDLTRARAGPTCVRQLVDWGARAIKIEMPGGRSGDGMGGNRHGFDFQNLHRNKRGLTLNLREPDGVAIFKQLVRDGDIVVENYRPDVKRRLGIDYESLRPLNPRLIYGSISGFGQSGPYRDRPGVDQIAQGMGGLMSITGIPGQGPVRVGIPIADLCSGILLAQGILVALLERETTGQGKWVHTSLLEAMLSMLDFQASRWLMSGEIPPQAGNNHPTGIPTGVFETKDGHINIAAAGDEIYERFCRAIERPDLQTDPRFATSRARSTNRDLLMEVLMPVTRQKASAEWVQIMNDAGVPCGPIYRVDEAFGDPQVRHLEMAQPVHSPALGDLTILGPPGLARSNSGMPIRTSAPELGQDNEEILTSLGYTKDQIADLAAPRHHLMKVTTLETYFLSAPLPQAVRTSTHTISRVSEVIVKLTTDAGLVGIGEAHGPFLFQGAEGLRTVNDILEAITPLVVGRRSLRRRADLAGPVRPDLPERAGHSRAGPSAAPAGDGHERHRHRAVGSQGQGHRDGRSTHCWAGPCASGCPPMSPASTTGTASGPMTSCARRLCTWSTATAR